MGFSIAYFVAAPSRLPLDRKSQVYRARTALETFHPRQPRGRRTESCEPLGRSSNYTGSLDKVVCAQRRGEPCGPSGRQDVVGSGEIVTERRRGETAEENRAS